MRIEESGTHVVPALYGAGEQVSRRSTRTLRLVAEVVSSCAVLALAGCAVGPDYQRPEIALTSAYRQAGSLAPPEAVSSPEWWRSFGDADLDRVIDRVTAQNLDLAQARARLDQARAMARRAGAARLPRAEVDAGASSQRSSLESPVGKIADALDAPRTYEEYDTGALATWELDLFGGLGRSQQAAGAEAQAAEVSAEAILLSTRAEAADAYLALRGFQARLQLAQSQQKTQDALVELIQERVDKGVSADRELKRAIGEQQRVRATIPPLLVQIEAQLNRLDVLMGAQPGTYRREFEHYVSQPTAPTPAASASPGALLRHRPDVVAAERRLAAADARIGAAIAGYYPQVSLSGTIGFDATSSSALFADDALRAQGIIGLRWRLFDFGRVDAEVAQARGREAELLAAYRGAVLRACEDVEGALSRLAQARVQSATLEQQVVALTDARRQAELAYRGGVLALIDVLDAERELLTASDLLAATRAESARAAVASYRALGGGWPG